MSKDITRRGFLGQAACAGLGSVAFYSSLLNLKALGAISQPRISAVGGDYRALVCVFLRGGNDSFNMLVPQSDSEYADYAATRSDLALSKDELLSLNFADDSGRRYGVHPSMPELKTLFESEKAAFVANLGTLREPLTKALIDSRGKSVLPRNLFSHADQAMQWQTSIPDRVSRTGFAGRLADLLHESNNIPDSSMNISLTGNNLFQSGSESVGYSVNANMNVPMIRHYARDNRLGRVKTAAIDSMLEAHYQDLFSSAFANNLRESVDGNMAFMEAMSSAPEFQTKFSETQFSEQLSAIAKIIAVREQLGMSRQTFFVNFGGWDHHDDTLIRQAEMLEVLSKGLNELNAALEEIGMSDKVTTFTASDFGRTLTSNGKGSDHAWGGNHIVMGGAVNGGKIYGEYPSLALGSQLEIGRGRIIPTVSTDEYFAELALWFGASTTDLDLLLPNINRFYDIRSGSNPIGFLS